VSKLLKFKKPGLDTQHGGGPITPEGKARSARNATRHGLTGKTVVLTTEDPAQFDELLDDYVKEYSPATRLQLDLVHELAACRWRLQRLWAIETCAFEITFARKQGIVDAEFRVCKPEMRTALAYMSMAQESDLLPILDRYETRLTRRTHQIMKELQILQNTPPPENCQTNSSGIGPSVRKRIPACDVISKCPQATPKPNQSPTTPPTTNKHPCSEQPPAEPPAGSEDHRHKK
jgi:hypothetical protein